MISYLGNAFIKTYFTVNVMILRLMKADMSLSLKNKSLIKIYHLIYTKFVLEPVWIEFH